MPDVFAQVPEFLAAFDNVKKYGFFEDIFFQVMGTGGNGKLSYVVIKIEGYIPNVPEFMNEGSGIIVDPEEILKRIRNLVNNIQVERISTEVKTENWPLWSEDEETILGSRGYKVNLYINIQF